MNIITKAINDLKYKIPGQVLRIAFTEQDSWRSAPISIDEQIRSKVINSRVLVDANMIGGQTVIISLEGLQAKYIDTYTVMYEIPMHLTNYRTIMSVLSISYLLYSTSFNALGSGMGVVNPNSMSDIMSAGQRVADSMSNIPPISNANVELVGHNTILLRDQLRTTNAYQLRCVVANEDDLSNISPRSFLAFSKLVELAVKSYIYNKLIIDIDMAYLVGGQELGAIKTYVEGLSDAEEMYVTHLNEVWSIASFCNDQSQFHRFIKLQLSPQV
jgi:hypothetical protein